MKKWNENIDVIHSIKIHKIQTMKMDKFQQRLLDKKRQTSPNIEEDLELHISDTPSPPEIYLWCTIFW